MCGLKRNSSLISLENMDELEYVTKLMQTNLNEAKSAFIGLVANETGKWEWLDTRTFWDSVFAPFYYSYRPETSHCGIINLVNGTKPAFEGRDCKDDETYFICKYSKK
ncbi:unnamed protein product [Didymodactylos carnosus]|uniref:C-type lectin domain-containing protein n=1 Tax=Didymodactylos carnosus TaxID=1234261 RepID=A0A814S4N4_9BILA|nr:unnamed protein product [Didymodactylos carnosus]CAF1140356.1 unnamed protein product [Didymodactylos carnosus]CAF3789189.1 unnamed protein product [Didymodactylos carnosus]CAF3904057.1 unnamed protein product [Didymodactylos carnosus]